MSVNTKQQKFARAIPLLMQYAQFIGYELTFGDAYRPKTCSHGHPRSTHRSRLAVDFNIFTGTRLLKKAEAEIAHSQLHDFWDMLGGSKRISNDLNHYSFKHNGVR